MAEWLVLRLARGREERVSWMSADARGQPLAAPQSGVLSQAASAAAGRRLAVIVPSSDVLMTDIELPIKSGVRVQQVVPFALEEQLAADIETLHFALGHRDDSSGRMAVAVVTRALMDQWLGALSAVGLAPEAMCTEAALLPDNPGKVVVLLEGDTLCVRRAGQMPLALPAMDVGVALTASLGDDTATENLIFYAAPEDWHRRAAEVETLRSRCASLKVQLLNFGPLPLLAPQLAAGGFLNLLSSDYAPKRAFGAGWQRWRLAAILAAALFAVHVSGLALQRQLQRHAEHTLDDAIGTIAHQALPADSGTGDVRERIEQRLLAAQDGAGQSGLLPALSALAQALRGAEGARVRSLSFQDNGLDLQLQARDAENLEKVDQSLRSNGWQAEITSGTNVGSAYQGHIQARAPAATRSPGAAGVRR